MSTTVDNRVLEMRFDNKQFESGVATSMSTLDKLKQKLNLSGAAKGLDGLSKAAKNFDLSGMTNGINTVNTRFSAMQVAGMTAIANITNSAVNAGKRMVSALTIDPVKTGLQEYETQINAVQTIMANVGHKGKTLDDVNAALDELNTYADKTIYNFTEMTRNIGLFTNAGVGLDDSVAAIKGFSNAAAMAGTDATRTAGAMYQLSQAMSTGKVQLMDWNSLSQANITGERFQDALKETARAHGIAIDAMIEKNGSLRDTLREGWLTADLMSEALNHYTLSTEEMTEAEQEAARVKMKSNGYTDEQIDKLFQLGTEATKAATKVKTFSQLWGNIRETAQSGWSKTWQIIIGDFEEAKALLTPLADFFNDLIGKTSDWRNNLLESALGKGFTDLIGKLTDAQKKQIKVFDKLSDAQLKSMDYSDKQIASLRELQATAEKLGMPFDDFINQLDEINGRWLLINSFKNIGEALGKVFGSFGGAWREVFDPIKPEQIFDAIAAIHKFTSSLIINKDTAEDLQRTFKGLFAALDIITTIAGGGIKFAFKALSTILGAFDMNILDVTGNIGDAITKFRDFLFEQNALAKTINGFIDNLPAVVANFKEWFNSFKETTAVQKLVTAIEAIQSAFDKLTSGEISISEFAKALGTKLANALKSLPEIAMQIGSDFIAGFQNGISDAFSGGIIDKIVSFCLDFVSAFAEALGVQSPSWKAYDIVVDFFQGAINGAKSMLGSVIGVFKTIGEQIVKIFKSFWDFITDESGNIEWDKIFAGGIVISMVWFLKQIASAFSGIADALGGFGKLFDNAGKVLKSFSKVLNGFAWDLKAKALQKMAIAIAILVGAVWVLTQIDDPAKLWNAVGVLAVLSAVLVGLAFAMDKMSQASVKIGKNGASIDGLKSGLLQIGIALLLLAATVKLIGDMNPKQAKQGFTALAGLAVGMLAFLAAIGGISRYSKNVSQIGGMMIKLSIAMMLIVGVIKLVDGLSAEEMLKGVAFAAAFAIFVMSITAVSKSAGNNVSKVGGMVFKLSIAMALMVGVCKLASMLSAGDMLKGAAFAFGFVILVRALVSASKIGKKQQLAAISGMVLSVSFSLLLMVGVCKIVGMLSIGEILKGAAFVAGFVILIRTLVGILTIGNEQQMAKVAGTILAMSVAIAILAGISIVLSLIDLGGLAKGIIAVGLLSAMMTAMIRALKGAQNVKGAIMMMAIAIGIMAASVIALTFIEPGKLAGATASLAIIMGMFALIEKSSENITKSILPLTTMVAAVGLLAGILYLLTNGIKDADAAVKVATSLGILMSALSVSMMAVSKAGHLSLGAIGSMAGMVLVLGGIALVLGIMSKFDVNPSIETATALSILLLSLAGVTAVLTNVKGGATAALGGIKAFAVVVVGVGALIFALGLLNDKITDGGLETFLDSGIPILEKIGVGIGKFIGGFIGGIGEGLMDSLVKMVSQFNVAMEGLVEASNTGAKIKPEGFDGVKQLLDTLGSIGLTTVGTTLSDIFTLGGTSIEKFQTDGVAFFDAMKEIAKSSEGLTVNEAGMEAVINVAQKLADLQSSLEPIGGFMSWLTGRDDLATFGDNIGLFLLSMKTAMSNFGDVTFNEEALDSIITAATSLSDLQSSLEPIGGFMVWLDGRDDLATFGVNVGLFLLSMKTALNYLGDFTFNEEALDSVITAATNLANLQSSLEPIGGLMSWLNGRDDLKTFGINASLFLSAMKTAINELGDVSYKEESLESVITAATKLSEFQSKLESLGGVISWFTGRSDLGTFGEKVGLFAEAMGKLKTEMGENGITEAAVTSITNAGDALIALHKALPEEGWFDGKMNLTDFSEYISDFSVAMSDFSAAASDINSEGIDTAITAAHRIRYLIGSLVGLDTSGLAAFTGIGTGGLGADGAVSDIGKAIADYSNEVADIDTGAVSISVSAALKLKSLIAGLAGLDTSGIENFKIDSIGKSIKSYASKVTGMDIGVVSNSISAANRLKNFIAGLTGLDTSGLVKFKVDSIGRALSSYSTSVSGFDAGAVSSSVSAASKLKDFISSLSGMDSSGVGIFVSAINELGTVSIDGIVKSFNGASSKMLIAGANLIESVKKGIISKQPGLSSTVTNMVSMAHKTVISRASLFITAGSTLMSKLASGISSARGAVSSAASSAVSSAARSIRAYYGSFQSAGSYLGSGLVIGINSKKAAAYSAAYALGQAAVQGEKAGQASNSPSKLTIQAGKWLGEGLVIGIDKMGSKVYNAGHDLGESAAKSMSSSISKVSDLINSGIDSTPTIRPVLDLSDVENGASAINGMFGRRLSIGTSANLDVVGHMMNRRIQNGGNDDVVSAINKLGRALDKMERPSYTINGVTYDDGSNISEAVGAIVRAARMEGRA